MSADIDRTDPPASQQRLHSVRRYIGWATLAYWGALFVATHIPLPPLPATGVGSDKVAHLAAFAGLGFLTALWLSLAGRLTIARTLLLLVVLSVYGAVDEWLQQFVGRFTDFDDWVANVSGAVIGIAVVWVLQTVRPVNQQQTTGSSGFSPHSQPRG
jgi:VanZ family protein